MKIKQLYLLAMLFILAGCSEKDPEPEQAFLLQRKSSAITFPSGGGLTIDLRYTYNASNQLIEISGVTVRDAETKTGTTTVSYDSEGRVSFVENALGTTWRVTYNDNDQVDRVVRKYRTAEPSIYAHSYNDAGQLTGVAVYRQTEGSLLMTGTIVYTYTGQNRIGIKRVDLSGLVNREHTILTDNHKRELPFLPHQINMEFYAAEVFAEPLLTQHNIVSNEAIDVVQGEKRGVSYTATYTYNQGGYPVTAVKTFEEGSVETITYEYKEVTE